MHMTRFEVKFPPGCAARKEKVARLQNDYERQIGRVQNVTTQQSICSQISFSSDFRELGSTEAMVMLRKSQDGNTDEFIIVRV